jgi:hypothetical protein
MFKGTMIDELIATVERAEVRAEREPSPIQIERLTYFYALAEREMYHFELQLAGVA